MLREIMLCLKDNIFVILAVISFMVGCAYWFSICDWIRAWKRFRQSDAAVKRNCELEHAQ